MTSNKILKISKVVNYFSQQVKLATGKVEEVFRLLKNYRSSGMFSTLTEGSSSIDQLTLGVKASELSEREVAELMSYIGETGNEKAIEAQTEALIEAIEDAVEQGKVNKNTANNAILFIQKEKQKALTPNPKALEEMAKEFNQPTSQQKPSQDQFQLAQKYYDALEDFESFVTANANGFNPNLRSKLSSKMEQFQNALSSYEANKKEMPIQTAQQWASPILLVIASLIATGNKNNSTQANNLWMQITKASNGQVAQGFSAGTWLTMRNNPYHQATQKDVADLAALGIKVEVGEFILPVDQIKKNPTNEQKAQMDAKKSVDRLKGEVKSISDKARQFF
jgi:hypothetical protein